MFIHHLAHLIVIHMINTINNNIKLKPNIYLAYFSKKVYLIFTKKIKSIKLIIT